MAKKPKAKKAKSARNKKKVRIEIFDPLGPGFRVFHKQAAARIHVGGRKAPAGDAPTGRKLTLDIFDPLGPRFRVLKKSVG
jgi:hypothetical protein